MLLTRQKTSVASYMTGAGGKVKRAVVPEGRAGGGRRRTVRDELIAAPSHVRGQAIQRLFSALYICIPAKHGIGALTLANRLSVTPEACRCG